MSTSSQYSSIIFFSFAEVYQRS